MMLQHPKLLTLKRLRKIYADNYGAAAQLARELGVQRQNISDFLKGRGRSRRVEDAVRQRALELIARNKRAPKSGKSQE